MTDYILSPQSWLTGLRRLRSSASHRKDLRYMKTISRLLTLLLTLAVVFGVTGKRNQLVRAG